MRVPLCLTATWPTCVANSSLLHPGSQQVPPSVSPSLSVPSVPEDDAVPSPLESPVEALTAGPLDPLVSFVPPVPPVLLVLLVSLVALVSLAAVVGPVGAVALSSAVAVSSAFEDPEVCTPPVLAVVEPAVVCAPPSPGQAGTTAATVNTNAEGIEG